METMIDNTLGERRIKADAPPRTWRDELDLVRWPLISFFAVLAAALLVVGSVAWMRAQQDEALARARQVHATASNQFHNVETEKYEIGLFQPRFLALQSGGLVGAENRLAWIEAVKQSQASRKLPSVTYEIEPQQVLATQVAMGDYTLRGSRMKLQMGLLHEGDLFNFLADLRQAGRFAVEDCKLKRTDVPADMALAPRLLGDCTLVWLSLSRKGMP